MDGPALLGTTGAAVNVHWVIQNNLYGEDGFHRLLDALTRLGSSYSLHKVVPFAHTLEPEFEATGPVVVMGTYTLVKMAKERGWTPGAWAPASLNMARYMTSPWNEHLFNSSRTSQVDKLKNVVDYFGDKRGFFIRPCEDSKAFTGYVTDWLSFVEWRDKLLALTPEDCSTVDGDTVVLCSDVKPISREWRTWIVDGKVVTASQYKLGSRKVESADVDERVINFANAMHTIWNGGYLGCGASPNDLAPAYCLDVFESEGELYIGEVNNLNSAGFYAGDMQKLVAAIEEMLR